MWAMFELAAKCCVPEDGVVYVDYGCLWYVNAFSSMVANSKMFIRIIAPFIPKSNISIRRYETL
jgi:hypothetical protein